MVVSVTDFNGVKSVFEYDGEDRIAKSTTRTNVMTYSYDSFGRLTEICAKDSIIQYQYTKYGELSQKIYENGDTIQYSYDNYGRTSEITDSTEKAEINKTSYEYDKMNRLTRVIGRNGEATVYTYDENGNRETATFANGVVLTYTYDDVNRLILQKAVDSKQMTIAQYTYTLGEGGERTHVEEQGPDGIFTTDYEYDKAGRLVKETIENVNGTETFEYSYDKVGNRTEKKEDDKKTTYSYNARNQLIGETTEDGAVTYSYDANGNLLSTNNGVSYTYDLYNRLTGYTAGGVTETYTYDAEGVRRSKTTNGESLFFVSDTTGSLSQTLAETDKDGNVIAAYTRADTLISQTRDEVTSIYLYDGHGDVRGLLNENGRYSDTYRYNAYGELLARKGDTENHYLYTGEYYDGTSNLYYLRARYMNPSTGTFISMDDYEGSIYDPDTLHKYLYANGNPVKYNDPSGNMSVVACAAATSICNIIQTTYNIHLMGLVAGMSNMAVKCMLGEQGTDLVGSFFDGYISGVFTGGLVCFAAAISVKAFAAVCLSISACDMAMSFVLLVASIREHNDKASLVYGTLFLLSIVDTCLSLNMCRDIYLVGDKGSAIVSVNPDMPNKVALEGGGKPNKIQFPNSPKDFNPEGLEKIGPFETKNGKIIKWIDENKKAVFEWDEDLKYGSHYHVIADDGNTRLPNSNGETHFLPGDTFEK